MNIFLGISYINLPIFFLGISYINLPVLFLRDSLYKLQVFFSGKSRQFGKEIPYKFSKSGIAKIGKEFPYIQKVEKLVRKSPINFQNPELPKLRNSQSKKSENW